MADGIMKYIGYFMVICAFAIITGLGSSGLFVILPMVCEMWSFTHIANTLSGKDSSP
jgi:hypothetical protein